MNLATKPTSAQWTVEKVAPSEDGGNAYVLREVATGHTDEVSTDADTSSTIQNLIHENLDMLKRLADR